MKMNESLGIKAENMSKYYPTMIGILNGIQIKIMSVLYSKIARWLTIWENHEKSSKYDMNLSLKIILFEFINNYSSLYYISFLKESFEGKCTGDNCLGELRLQIYIILITNFFFNLVEIGLPFVMDYFNKKDYLKNYPAGVEIDFTPHAIHQQLVAEEFSTLRDDYNEMVIQFGYLTFFSVAAPLTPFICFLLTFIEVNLFFIFRNLLTHIKCFIYIV